jgi:hypothetical protein
VVLPEQNVAKQKMAITPIRVGTQIAAEFPLGIG